MGKFVRPWLVSLLAVFACVDNKGTSSPTVAGGGDSPTDTAVCATCQQRAGGETADFGAAPGAGGSEACASVEAPLTPEVEQAFGLAQLRAFLAGPRVVIAEPHEIPDAQPKLEGPIEIEFKFELGEFTYRMGQDCDSVSAPVQVNVEVGHGLLSFRASGGMFKQAGKLNAFMYTKADLATATGSYRPFIDDSHPHIGQIEIPIYVYPDQLRGSVLPELLYFQNQDALTRWLEGTPAGAPGAASFPSFTTPVQLDFPVDDCMDAEWPLALDAALELLGGRSPGQIRSDVVARIAPQTSFPAVWNDNSETVVRVEVSEGAADSVCARASDKPASMRDGPEFELAMSAMGSLRTDDGKIDTVLNRLTVTVGGEHGETRSARLRGFMPEAPGQTFDAWINYAFDNGAVSTEGIVHFLNEVSPGAGTYGDCVAFPPGGKTDKDDCRYVRRP